MNDHINNGTAHGPVASALIRNDFDVGVLRPWIGSNGRSYVTRQRPGGKFEALELQAANATLTKEEWKAIDEAVMAAAQSRLGAVQRLIDLGLVYNLSNGLGRTALESARASDISGASVSMDPARTGDQDRPEFDLVNLPLPVVHKDFSFSARQLAVSRNGNAPLDLTMAELAGRKVAEEVEKLLLGVSETITFGGGTVYGLTNFPQRQTKTLTSPAASGWTPRKLLLEVLDMRRSSANAKYYGPWGLFFSPDWDPYLDDDFSTAKGDVTLRQRLAQIDGIEFVETANLLTGYQAILVQLSSDTVRIVNGLDVTTVQWETIGGLQVNFKVLAIMVPQVRADYSGNCGVVHGATA